MYSASTSGRATLVPRSPPPPPPGGAGPPLPKLGGEDEDVLGEPLLATSYAPHHCSRPLNATIFLLFLLLFLPPIIDKTLSPHVIFALFYLLSWKKYMKLNPKASFNDILIIPFVFQFWFDIGNSGRSEKQLDGQTYCVRLELIITHPQFQQKCLV